MQNRWEREGGEEMQRVSFSEMFQRKKWQILPTSIQSCVEETTADHSQCLRNQCRLLRKTAGQQVSHQAAGQLC